jgi:hypothetical protein
MKREDFEHVIRAAADVVHDELVVVGSQAVLGVIDNPPSSLLRSAELDMYPRHDPSRAGEIDGALGDGSRFHETYGYYAHGVGPETITAPAGWEDRLVRRALPAIRQKDGSAVCWCLSIGDLIHAKLAAGRPHDLEFVEAALRAGLVDVEQLRLGLELMPESARGDVQIRLDGLLAKISRTG